MITGTSTVAEFLYSQVDYSDFFDVITESNELSNAKTKNFIQLEFQLVMDILNGLNSESIISLVSKLTNLDEQELLKLNASDFLSYLKFIKNQCDIISQLFISLQKDNFDNDDAMLQSAGIEKLNKYNEIMIYYNIDKNPTTWEAIGKQPFSVILVKLSIDKDIGEINKSYSELLKQKNK